MLRRAHRDDILVIDDVRSARGGRLHDNTLYPELTTVVAAVAAAQPSWTVLVRDGMLLAADARHADAVAQF